MPGTLARARSRSLAARWRGTVRRAEGTGHAGAVPEAVSADVSADAVTVTLADGRAVSVPLAWSARLLYATPDERADVEADPFGLYWPQVNEAWSVEGMLAGQADGRPWGEGADGFAVWRALMDRRRAQIAAGEEPEPHYPTLPLPDGWDAD